MTTHATCTFEITAWEAVEYDDQDSVKLTRTHVGKAFHGDMEGQSTAELLMAGAPTGSAVYVGLERIVGRLHERSGSFVLIHDASMSSDGQSLSLTIMRDSGPTAATRSRSTMPSTDGFICYLLQQQERSAMRYDTE